MSFLSAPDVHFWQRFPYEGAARNIDASLLSAGPGDSDWFEKYACFTLWVQSEAHLAKKIYFSFTDGAFNVHFPNEM